MTYYANDGGLGKALRAIRTKRAGSPLKIGGIGLGLGGATELLEGGDQIVFGK